MENSLQSVLFPDDGEVTYAIIDGASCEELLGKLGEHEPRHFCLYEGELAPDVKEVAPYLVELLPDHPFTDWLLEHFPGKHWGIFARSSEGLRATRGHLRRFLLVKGPDRKTLYFRYYDPRVLPLFFANCQASRNAEIFRQAFGVVQRG